MQEEAENNENVQPTDLTIELEERVITPHKGGSMATVAVACIIIGVALNVAAQGMWPLNIAGVLMVIIGVNIWRGGKELEPNDAVLCLFLGEYVGTVKEPGFIWINPLYTQYQISLKQQNFSTVKSVVNDANGLPIEIQGNIAWKIKDGAKAIFEVENYYHYISIQCESAMRELASKFPFQPDYEGGPSLRGDVSDALEEIVQREIKSAGLEVVEAKIAEVNYTPEIAASMLRVQQADAMVAAKAKIVESAITMVSQAIEELESTGVANLDAQRRSELVSNLLVILVGEER